MAHCIRWLIISRSGCCGYGCEARTTGATTSGSGSGGAPRGSASGVGAAIAGGATLAATSTSNAGARALIPSPCIANLVFAIFHRYFPSMYRRSPVRFSIAGKGTTFSIITP